MQASFTNERHNIPMRHQRRLMHEREIREQRLASPFIANEATRHTRNHGR